MSTQAVVIPICKAAVAITAFAGAAVVAYYGKDAWGWLIFAGLLAL